MKLIHAVAPIAVAITLASCAVVGPSYEQRLAGEKHACAEAGIIPETPVFSHCYTALEEVITNDETISDR